MSTVINFTTVNVSIGQDLGQLFYVIDSVRTDIIGTGPITLNNVSLSTVPVPTITQVTDITISDFSDYFIGGSGSFVFDGNDKTVTLDGVSGYGGLFRSLEAGQTVQNVNVVGVGSGILAGGAGAIVGSLNGGVVIDSSSSVPIDNLGAGGIVGAFNSGSIQNSFSTGIISGNNAGGIVGASTASPTQDIEINNVYSTGEIAGFAAGGIMGAEAGNTRGTVTIENAYSTGDITGNEAGGILGAYAGVSEGFVTITNSFSFGEISGDGAGGIVGAGAGGYLGKVEIENSFSIGEISGDGAGGIVGGAAAMFSGEVYVRASYSIGQISGSDAGGIVGAYAGPVNGLVEVADSFSVGAIAGFDSGGIVGAMAAVANGGTVTIQNSYSAGDIIGENSGGIVGAEAAAINGGTVTIENVYSAGNILGQYSGGIVGAMAAADGSGVVAVNHAYSAGFIVDPVISGGIFADIPSDPSIDSENPTGPFLYGANNYAEGTFSTGWDDVDANATLVDPPLDSDIWVDSDPDLVNTPYTLAAFSPTVSETSNLGGITINQTYTITFADLLSASNATSLFGAVGPIARFEVQLDLTKGSYYSGATPSSALPVSGSNIVIDSSNNLYWQPNQIGTLTIGSAVAVSDNSLIASANPSATYQFDSVMASAILINVEALPVDTPRVFMIGSFAADYERVGYGEHSFIGPNSIATIDITNLQTGYIGGITEAITVEDLSGLYETPATLAAAFNKHALPFAKISEPLLQEVLGADSSQQLVNYLFASDFIQKGNRSLTRSNILDIDNILAEISDVLIVNKDLNQKGIQNLDLSDFSGLAIVGQGINIKGLTEANSAIVQGNAAYTMSIGNEMLVLKGAGAAVDGGLGIDTVFFADASVADSQITKVAGQSLIVRTDQGSSYLKEIERIRFNDGAIAFDTGADGNAGEVYRLYQTAFNRTPDAVGLGFWMHQLDHGTSLEDIALAFVESNEFQTNHANLSNDDFINLMYTNAFQRQGDLTDLTHWQGELARGVDKAEILAHFSESPEHAINVTGYINNGVQYQQWFG